MTIQSTELHNRMWDEINRLKYDFAHMREFNQMLDEELRQPGKAGHLETPFFSTWGGRAVKLGLLFGVNHIERITAAGAAIELLMLSADLFDDCMDQDGGKLESSFEPGHLLRIAFAQWIFSLSYHAFLKLDIDTGLAGRLLQEVNSLSMDALWGQWRADAHVYPFSSTEERYILMIEESSGKLGKLVCAVIALIARLDQKVTDRLKEIGSMLAISGQISNDARDIMNDRKLDFKRLKMSLPLIMAISHSERRHDFFHSMLEYIYRQPMEAEIYKQQLRDYMVNVGAIDYANIKARLIDHEAELALVALHSDWQSKQSCPGA
ncbi:polyprenyl synthetase family protein [Paenibacillus rhizophilus]|uniref:Polyprenyl synthetase n=1 Tax=Paenibacillus rhizophilus TaxID=1850366 RepID=A0A3N9PWT9_9BACL|nr:polyprenyl synthetase family protein [Paenibacillus rhizophilus]RQW09676.1 hypothetical protein EH198_18045 [Paenibacillus rhizophilus]